MLTADQQRAIEHDCQQLVAQFAFHLDHGNGVQAANLFTEQGAWDWAGTLVQGRAAIEQHCIRKPTHVSRHLPCNVWIEVIDATHAKGFSYFLFYVSSLDAQHPTLPAPLKTPFSIGEWHDTYVRTEHGWRIATRHTVRVMLAARPAASPTAAT